MYIATGATSYLVPVTVKEVHAIRIFSYCIAQNFDGGNFDGY